MLLIYRKRFYTSWPSHIALRFEGRDSKRYLTESRVFHWVEVPLRESVMWNLRIPVSGYLREAGY